MNQLRKCALAAALCILSALALAACGGTETPTTTTGAASGGGTAIPAAQGDVQELRIVATDNMFNPKDYEVQAGKAIRLTVVNEGQNIHNVEVKDLLPETNLAPKQSKTVDIPAQKAGATFTIYCEIHEDSGMTGQLTVK